MGYPPKLDRHALAEWCKDPANRRTQLILPDEMYRTFSSDHWRESKFVYISVGQTQWLLHRWLYHTVVHELEPGERLILNNFWDSQDPRDQNPWHYELASARAATRNRSEAHWERLNKPNRKFDEYDFKFRAKRRRK